MATKYLQKFADTTAFLGNAPDRDKFQGFGVVGDLVYQNIDGSAVAMVDLTTAQVLTNKTLTGPVLTAPSITGAGTQTGGTITGATLVGNLVSDIQFCTTQFDAVTGSTGVTFTNIVGLTGFAVVAGGVYDFEINIAGVSTANCGIKLALKFTTATLTAMEAMGHGFTASAVAVQHTTTATDQAPLFAQTAAVISVRIKGRIVVNAAGTIAVQAAQNALHADTTSVYIGSSARFTRVS